MSVPLFLRPAKSHFGANHSAYVQSNGTVAVSGLNANGQLGLNNTTQQNTAVAVSTSKTAKIVAVGQANTAVVFTDGTLSACGQNSTGELGLGATAQFTSLTQVTTNLTGKIVTDVAFGNLHMAVVTLDGGLFTTGSGANGRLGLGNTTTYNTLQQVTLPFGLSAYSVCCGGTYTLVLCKDGTLLAFGDNTYGQLGDGTTTQRLSPVRVTSGVAAIYCGEFTSFAVMQNNTLIAWGNNGSGLSFTGTGSSSTTVLTPTAVTLPGGKIIETMSATQVAAMILFTDNTLYGWGTNTNNVLGNLTLNQNYTTPTLMDPFGGSSYTINNIVTTGLMTHIFYTNVTNILGYFGNYSSGKAGNGTATATSSTTSVVSAWAPLGGVSTKYTLTRPPQPTITPNPLVESTNATYYWGFTETTNVSSITLVLNGTARTVPATSRETTFTSLTNGTNYDCLIYASSADDYSFFSNYRQIQPGGTPGVPTVTQAVNVSPTSLSVSWNAAASNGAVIRWYLVYAYDSEGNYAVAFPFEGYKRTSITPDFPNGTYDLYLKAINDAGHGEGALIGTYTFPTP